MTSQRSLSIAMPEKEKKVWLDADTFTKHKVTIPNKFAYLLENSEGPKSA